MGRSTHRHEHVAQQSTRCAHQKEEPAAPPVNEEEADDNPGELEEKQDTGRQNYRCSQPTKLTLKDKSTSYPLHPTSDCPPP